MDSAVCPGSLPAVPSLLCWTPRGLWGWMPPPVPVLFLLWAKLLTPAGCVGLALPLRLPGASPCWGWRTGPGRRSHGREDLGSCQAFLPSLARRVGTARALASALPTACWLLRNPGPQLPHTETVVDHSICLVEFLSGLNIVKQWKALGILPT